MAELVHQLPRHISADDVEKINNLVAEQAADELTLDISAFKRSRLFAEGRFLGLLALARDRGIRTIVRIGSELPPYDSTSPGKYWKIFLESISGLIFAEFAAGILDPSARNCISVVREKQAAMLKETQGFIGSGKEIAAPIIDRFGRPPASEVVIEDDIRLFTASFRKLLFERLGLPILNEAEINNICAYAFETLQNTRDHGCTDLQGSPINGIRLISVRRLNLPQEPFAELIGSEQTPVTSYLKALEGDLGRSFLGSERLVEVTIGDSGVGIPARMAKTKEVYRASLEEERKYLLEALKPTGTSKAQSVAGAGLGLYKVMQATHHLKGLIVFRAGRLFMYRHYLAENRQWPSLELYEWNEKPYRLVAGTCVSLIFPWIEAGQLSLYSG